MKPVLRATTPDDAGRLTAFLRRAFDAGPDAPFLDPALMAWKYWDRRDDWPEARSYVLEREGAIVSHVGIWPVILGTVRGASMLDWASAKDSPGSGLTLLQKLAGKFDFLYSSGGSEMTRKVLPAFGFVEHARAWRAARPLRPLSQMLSHQFRNWKLAPRLARNWLWSMQPAARPATGWASEEIAAEEVSSALFSEDLAEARLIPRPAAFFDYLRRCPGVPCRVWRMQGAGATQGYYALGVLHGQARIGGVWLRNPVHDHWRAAYSLAQQTAAQLADACEIAAVGTEGVSAEAAVEAGLRIRETRPVFLMTRKGGPSLRRDFEFQLADDDGIFLDVGDFYWT